MRLTRPTLAPNLSCFLWDDTPGSILNDSLNITENECLYPFTDLLLLPQNFGYSI